MPTLSKTLTEASQRIKASGSQFVHLPLAHVGLVSALLEYLSIPLDSDEGAAALLWSNLPAEAAEESARALNIRIPNVEALKRLADNQMFSMGPSLYMVLSGSSLPDAVVAAAKLLVAIAGAAETGNVERVESLKKSARDAANPGAQNIQVAKGLLTVAEGLEVKTVVGPIERYQFSISIDLVGSTRAKSDIQSVAKGDIARIDELNTWIYDRFCEIEQRFYVSATRREGFAPSIPIKNFFTVKGIGDEIWILCDAPVDVLEQTGHRLVDAAVEIATKSVHLFATSKEENWDADISLDDVRPIKAPVKIYIDLIENATPLGPRRDQRLFSLAEGFLARGGGSVSPHDALLTVANRLCLATLEPVGWSVFNRARTDLIGHEIDLFFRTSKAATAGTVTIGEHMVDRLGWTFKRHTGRAFKVSMSNNTLLRGGEPSDPLCAIRRRLTKRELKGIGYSYDVYTLFGPRSLRGLYVQYEADGNNGFPQVLYEATMELINPRLVTRLAEEIYSMQK